MAYREVGVIDLQEVLRRFCLGEGLRAIARATGESFRDPAEMQARAVEWCRDIAGTRVHGTTRQVPRVVFENRRARRPPAAEPGALRRPTWGRGDRPSRSPPPVPPRPLFRADAVYRPPRGRPR